MSEPLSVEEVQALGEHIAEQAVHLDAAMHRLLADLRTFDAAGGWYRQGFGTCAHWLSWRVGWDLGTAREHLRVARALHTLPLVSAALSAGKISYSKTRAITRVATAATEAVLLGYAQHCTASQLETVCRKVGVLGADAASRAARPHDSERLWRTRRRPLAWCASRRACAPTRPRCCFRCCSKRRWTARASRQRLPQRSRTFPRKRQHLPSDRRTSPRRRGASPTTTTTRRPYNRADGLMALVHTYARGGSVERSPVELIVTVPVALQQQPAATTSTTDSATTAPATAALAPASFTDRGASLPVALTVEADLALSPQATRRLDGDCGLVVATVAAATVTDAAPLSIGRKTRTIPAALKRALLLRDRTCRFPGCDHRLFLEGHHLQHWADGGETNLDNLALLCSLHHAYVHERGYRITQSPTGDLAFEDPQGRAVVPLPPRPAPTLLGWPAIHAVRAANAANAALPLTATTGHCRWRGERVDSWDAAATIARIQRRADAAAAPAAPAPSAPNTSLTTAPAASPPPFFPRTPSPPSPLPSLADPPLDPDGSPCAASGTTSTRHSAIERWVLAEMEATGVDPLHRPPAGPPAAPVAA
ncbi:MAG: DUF222 domain-containing protein, partial [Myxococcales bacterium]|nr:DUF222 domain-containing protein [Myxococcales bacterium]